MEMCLEIVVWMFRFMQFLNPQICDNVNSSDGSLSADSSNTGGNGWFSFEMNAAGSASVNVDALTDFPEFIETTVYSDCDGSVASCR